MKKERIFYLDFIRAIATIAIIITHFNALYLYLPNPTPEKAFITTTVANIYIGSFGVSLFFIISGAALMFVYDEKCETGLFYKKRFLSLYPMFWMVFLLDFLIFNYLNGGINTNIPKWKIIFSVLGIDHYISEFTLTFARVGEWFLGCILIIYLLFPLLRILVKKQPVVTMIVLVVLAGGMIILDNGFFPLSKNVIVRLPEFVFGMVFVKYIKKIKWPVALASLVVLVVNSIMKPSAINNSIQTAYVGIATFLFLVWISDYLNVKPVRYISGVVSKYSYAIFLVHHVIILRIASYVNLETITKTDSYLLFFLCVICIGFISRWTFYLHSGMMKVIKEMFSKEKI